MLLLAPALRGRADPQDRISFVARPQLPIVFQPSRGTGLVEAVAPDIRIDAFARTAEGDVAVFTLSMGIRADIGVALSADEVRVQITDYRVQVDPIGDVPPGTPLGPALDELFRVVVDPIVAPYLELGGLPIPSLGGFAFDAPRASLDDSYLVFEGTIEYVGM